MRYKIVFLFLCIVALLLAVVGILWRDSEQQYVAMTNLAQRLQVLQQAGLNDKQSGPKIWPSWQTSWKPLVLAMQFEAKQAVLRGRGFHLSQPMYEQLLNFAEMKIDDESGLKKFLAQLNFSGDVVAAKAPFVFFEQERIDSSTTVTGFRNEVSAALASEAALSEWLSPILLQQKALDQSVTCKTVAELKTFQAYADRIRKKCAADTKKWAVCSGEDESIARQVKELQTSSESNLNKFKSRWFVDNVNELCAGI